MPLDALDPGEDYTYPNLPRTPDGRLDTELMPVGLRWQRGADSGMHLIDVTPTVWNAAGELVLITDICPP